MSYYEDFKAKSVQTPEMLAELIEQNGGTLAVYFIYGLGANSFIRKEVLQSDFRILTTQAMADCENPEEWFEFNYSGENRTYSSFRDRGITDQPYNKHLTFVDRDVAEAYVAAVKNDPIEVARQIEIWAELDFMEKNFSDYYEGDSSE